MALAEQRVPRPKSSEPWTLSPSALAAAIRRGELSSRQAVEHFAARIEAFDGAINAVVFRRFEQALREADAADQKKSDLGPLHGVPFTVKEMIAVTGAPLSMGSLARKDLRSTRDATVVARLRAAGAIPIALTNLPEYAMWQETENLVYGRTSNPYDVRCGVGGSSGGEAAAVASGFSSFGIGSDTGGSIRIPAAFCGVFGHKPSAGLVPLTGQYPLDEFSIASGKPTGSLPFHTTIGPFARSAADLPLLLKLISGPDGHDPFCRPWVSDAPRAAKRIFLWEAPKLSRSTAVDAELQRAAKHAAQALTGHAIVWDGAPYVQAFDMWVAALHAWPGQSMESSLSEAPIGVIAELVRLSIGRGRFSFPALGAVVAERLFPMSQRRIDQLLEKARALRAQLVATLGDDAVLIAPVHPRAAEVHHHAKLRPFDCSHTALWNVLGAPATVVPTGLGPAGVPLAVQVIAAPGQDALALHTAQALEARGFAYVAPSFSRAPVPSAR